MLKTRNRITLNVAVVAVMFVFAALIPSCKKEQPISNVPSITFNSISPNPAIKYVDTITIVISYTDGDGDLGVDSPDVKNMFVTDSRNNVTSSFRIRQLAPSGSNIAIEGKLDIVLPAQIFVNDNDTTETATFSVYVVDRAGHKSNMVQTTPLVINK
jgi:hypothetical protein